MSTMSLAVEQLGGALYVLPSLAGLRMGLETGKVLAMRADLGERAGSGSNRAPLDCISAGLPEQWPISNSFRHASNSIRPRFDQGRRGSDLGGRADGRMDSDAQNNFALARLSKLSAASTDMTTKAFPSDDFSDEKKEEAGAKAALRSAVADKRKCPVCLLSVCPAAWVQCFGEDECPNHWELLKKERGAA